MYTVEHGVKVFDFGKVHDSNIGRLQSQWINVVTDRKASGSVTELDQMIAGLSLEEGSDAGGDEVETEKDEEEGADYSGRRRR
jgi:hypothetical protein